jgi:hypothetical protein
MKIKIKQTDKTQNKIVVNMGEVVGEEVQGTRGNHLGPSSRDQNLTIDQ